MRPKDLIEEAYRKLRNKQTRINKFYILKRYLRMKYRLEISKSCLYNRIKTYLKTS